ncbi:hypothetical protein [Pseudomonas alcaligenes]|uniref:hypothetical protein n=1 Tax=Aquipseudomonas alcaligenes TaxID=43263 RepID=UPI00358E7705
MGYYTNAVADLDAFRSAIIDACVAEGWTLSGAILSKAGMFLTLQVVSGQLKLRGGTGAAAGALTDPSTEVTIAAGGGGSSIVPLTFPATYHLFVFDQEVYCVLNYSVNRYQWCAWGKSTVGGLVSSGMWLGATWGGVASGSGFSIGLNTNSTANPSGALMWAAHPNNTTRTSLIAAGLDGKTWFTDDWLGGTYVANEILATQPNSFNSESVLVPIRAYAPRPSLKWSLVTDLVYARYLRIDNYEPGQLIELGTDRWMVFPWHQKNPAARNGGGAINHTGTFGWAIRYEGP